MSAHTTTAAPVTKDRTIQIQDQDICLHIWNEDGVNKNNNNDKKKGIVCIFHGFAAHGKYPTVRYAAEKLATSNFIVIAPDLPGHGSSGLSGYISNATTLLNIGTEILRYIQKEYNHENTKKMFLVGSSMGGTIALSVAQKIMATQDISSSSSSSVTISGVVLLAPMLMLSVSTIEQYLLSGLSMLPIISTAQLIPSSATSLEKQYRDVEKRKECENDTLSFSGKLRIGSASSCVNMTTYIQSQFTSISNIPFLLMVADEDVVVKNEGSFNLMEQSPSKDKTMKRYPALHGLLCEPKPLIDQIQNDLISWIDERA